MSESWKMFFDRAARQNRAKFRVIFTTPKREVLSFTFSLTEYCFNNMAKYQALILGDSQFVIRQLLLFYEVRKLELVPYHKYALKLMTSLDCITLEHVS
jgi:hypothetical protein